MPGTSSWTACKQLTSVTATQPGMVVTTFPACGH